MSIESKLLKLMEGTEGYVPLVAGTHVQIIDAAHPSNGATSKIVTVQKEGEEVPMYHLEGIEMPVSHNQIKVVDPVGVAPVTEAKKDGDDDQDDKKADQVDSEPAVTIDNPINPDLDPSENPNQEVDDQLTDMQNSEEEEEEKEKEQAMKEDIDKGAFHRWLGKPEDADITQADIEKGLASDDKHVRKMAQFAKNMQHMHESVKQDSTETMNTILEDTELSEEFKLKAATLFEAKVTEKASKLVEERIGQLEEEYQTRLSEAVSVIEKELHENMDEYFGALSERWMKDNELALEASIKSDLTESFIEGMKQLFESHWIDLPVEKFDIVNSLEDKNKQISEELENTKKLLEEQAEELKKANREIILENATKGMTDIDSSKFRTLMEDFDFESAELYTKRAEIIKESFFGNGKKETKDQSSKLDVSAKPLIEETNLNPNKKTTEVSQYADFIRKTAKTN